MHSLLITPFKRPTSSSVQPLWAQLQLLCVAAAVEPVSVDAVARYTAALNLWCNEDLATVSALWLLFIAPDKASLNHPGFEPVVLPSDITDVLPIHHRILSSFATEYSPPYIYIYFTLTLHLFCCNGTDLHRGQTQLMVLSLAPRSKLAEVCIS